MNKSEVRRIALECVQLIRSIEFERLGISQYNLEYIQRLLPDLEYFFSIYTDSILVLLQHRKPSPEVFVDFGGGHGFLSILLKKLGFKVIYCDYNPLSVQTITRLKETTGFGPDHIVEGSSAELHTYCITHNLNPNCLIATDLIEHVYDLDAFFADLHQINPELEMIFTTGSNPSNFYKTWKLRKIMVSIEKAMFLPMRTDFIRKNYPDLTEEEISLLAELTRGLTYKDIVDKMNVYIETKKLPPLCVDKYNTCDPQSGNWMERILPLKDYRSILKKHGFKVEFKKGLYNENRTIRLISFAMKALNKAIKYSGFPGRTICAYLIIKVTKIK